MNVRDLKLGIICGNESDEIKALNDFFKNLFGDVKLYTYGNTTDLIFMKGDICIMHQDVHHDIIYCRYDIIVEFLEKKYTNNYITIQSIIEYKLEEFFENVTQTPVFMQFLKFPFLEIAFKNNKLIPYKI